MSDADILAQRRRYEEILDWDKPRRRLTKVRRFRRRGDRVQPVLDPQAPARVL